MSQCCCTKRPMSLAPLPNCQWRFAACTKKTAAASAKEAGRIQAGNGRSSPLFGAPPRGQATAAATRGARRKKVGSGSRTMKTPAHRGEGGGRGVQASAGSDGRSSADGRARDRSRCDEVRSRGRRRWGTRTPAMPRPHSAPAAAARDRTALASAHRHPRGSAAWASGGAPRNTRSLPTASTSISICLRFPAIVTSWTGWMSGPSRSSGRPRPASSRPRRGRRRSRSGR